MADGNFVVIFTKTNWNEAPRIRHQITDLLRKKGKKVIFFQKASQSRFRSTITKVDDGFYLVDYYELLHHQLKFTSSLVALNNVLLERTISTLLKNFEVDFIINFNYDYSFLKNIFQKEKIITLINDDFIAQAKNYRKSMAKKLLRDTCKNSDAVFGVSYSIVKQLTHYNANTKLFLPWALEKYVAPSHNLSRNVVLFYGYINNRLNWKIIEEMFEHNIKLRFVGPVNDNCKERMASYKIKYKTFEYAGMSDIEELYTEDVLVSIIPYIEDSAEIQAITINNKAFNLLSKGLPLIYPDLPNLIKVNKNIISKYKSIDDIDSIVEYFSEFFYNIQNDLKVFLEEHYENSRYQLLMSEVENDNKLV